MKNLVQQDGDPLTVAVPDTYASGDIFFSAQPAEDSTITLNGVVWPFKASGASGDESNLGADLNATLDAFVTAYNASSTAELAGATASSSPTTATTLRFTFDTAGAEGNAYTLAASAESNGTPSAATLRGGGGVKSGDGVAIGALFGIAAYDAASAGTTEISSRGVYILPKTPSAAIATGAQCWWQPAFHEVVPATGTGFVCIGVAVEDAAAADRTVKVLLGTHPAAGV